MDIGLYGIAKVFTNKTVLLLFSSLNDRADKRHTEGCITQSYSKLWGDLQVCFMSCISCVPPSRIFQRSSLPLNPVSPAFSVSIQVLWRSGSDLWVFSYLSDHDFSPQNSLVGHPAVETVLVDPSFFHMTRSRSEACYSSASEPYRHLFSFHGSHLCSDMLYIGYIYSY